MIYELILRQIFSRDLLDNWLEDVFLFEAGMAQRHTEFDKFGSRIWVEPFAESFNETVGNCEIVPAWARKHFEYRNQLLQLIRLDLLGVLLVERFQNLMTRGHNAVTPLIIYFGQAAEHNFGRFIDT